MLSSNGVVQARVATSFLFSLPACDRDGNGEEQGLRWVRTPEPEAEKNNLPNNHERCLQIEASL